MRKIRLRWTIRNVNIASISMLKLYTKVPKYLQGTDKRLIFDSLHILISVLYCFKHASSIIFPRNRINLTVSKSMLEPLRALRISAVYITQYASPHVKTCFGNGFQELSDTLDILYTHVLKNGLKFRSRNLQYGPPDISFKVVLCVNGFAKSLYPLPHR